MAMNRRKTVSEDLLGQKTVRKKSVYPSVITVISCESRCSGT